MWVNYFGKLFFQLSPFVLWIISSQICFHLTPHFAVLILKMKKRKYFKLLTIISNVFAEFHIANTICKFEKEIFVLYCRMTKSMSVKTRCILTIFPKINCLVFSHCNNKLREKWWVWHKSTHCHSLICWPFYKNIQVVCIKNQIKICQKFLNRNWQKRLTKWGILHDWSYLRSKILS